VVVGVSPDTVKSHQDFKAAHDLPFTLVADTDHAIADRYGVWAEKSMYGKKYWGVVRSTFLIDAQGRIARIFAKVKPQGHAAVVAEAVKDLR
jgi:peroxiredoxin Q/BCP